MDKGRGGACFSDHSSHKDALAAFFVFPVRPDSLDISTDCSGLLGFWSCCWCSSKEGRVDPSIISLSLWLTTISQQVYNQLQ